MKKFLALLLTLPLVCLSLLGPQFATAADSAELTTLKQQEQSTRLSIGALLSIKDSAQSRTADQIHLSAANNLTSLADLRVALINYGKSEGADSTQYKTYADLLQKYQDSYGDFVKERVDGGDTYSYPFPPKTIPDLATAKNDQQTLQNAESLANAAKGASDSLKNSVTGASSSDPCKGLCEPAFSNVNPVIKSILTGLCCLLQSFLQSLQSLLSTISAQIQGGLDQL